MTDKKSESSPSKNDYVEDRIARSFERVASTTERVGIPAATFAIGALVIGLNAKGELPAPEIFAHVGK